MEITKAQLKKLTDARSWQRGVNYHEQGNVISLLEDKYTVIGKDKALEWAEKGLKAFAEGTDSRLWEFLANEYHRRRRYTKAYREVVRLIKKIRELMKGLGKDKEFAEYVSSLKVKYQRKRNFMKLLNRLRYI